MSSSILSIALQFKLPLWTCCKSIASVCAKHESIQSNWKCNSISLSFSSFFWLLFPFYFVLSPSFFPALIHHSLTLFLPLVQLTAIFFIFTQMKTEKSCPACCCTFLKGREYKLQIQEDNNCCRNKRKSGLRNEEKVIAIKMKICKMNHGAESKSKFTQHYNWGWIWKLKIKELNVLRKRRNFSKMESMEIKNKYLQTSMISKIYDKCCSETV